MPELAQSEKPLREAFEGKRVLVTGHTGFKGGWLCLWLRRLGAEVTGVALPPYEGNSFFEALNFYELVDHRIADIRNPAELQAAIAGDEFDFVFHMAAQSLVRPSYAQPAETFATNVTGTANVLDIVRAMPDARGALVITTDKCYQNNEWEWPYRETDALGGSDPYSASKACTELVAASYRQSFFVDPAGCQVATARAGNVFGGGDWAVDRLVPDIVRAIARKQSVTIRNPASVRPWQHVLEPLHGYLMLGARLMASDGPRWAEAWNFGPRPNDFIEVEQIARGFIRAWGPGAVDIEFGRRADDPHEARLLTLDSSKARARLGWRPRLPAVQAISLAAEWYRDHAAGKDMRQRTESQIASYARLGETVTQLKDEELQCA